MYKIDRRGEGGGVQKSYTRTDPFIIFRFSSYHPNSDLLSLYPRTPNKPNSGFNLQILPDIFQLYYHVSLYFLRKHIL